MFDYIISGGGCAGLSLLVHMIRSGAFTDKKILLADKGPKTGNDRTWCFWEKGKGPFEEVVYRKWDRLWFHGQGYSALKDIGPYRYKMIRSLDFYQYCHELIRRQKNIEVLYGHIDSVRSDEKATYIKVDGREIPGRFIFNSVLPGPRRPLSRHHYLLQHFKGWIINSEKALFNPEEATLMDFRVSQEWGTTFVYTMPFSPTRALVEYTIFSEKIPEQMAYDEGLANYVSEFLHAGKYSIEEEEYGIIPMTDHPIEGRVHNIVPVGTAGGCTKASSGYTFQFIQKQSGAITASLRLTGDPSISGRAASSDKYLTGLHPAGRNRFRFYDSVLLNVLSTGKLSGELVFTDLFSRNRIGDLFSFLDNESDLLQDFRIIRTLPAIPFLKAAFQHILH